MIELVFWSSIGLLFASYVAYPGVIFILAEIMPVRIKKHNITPTVTLLIAAHNEEQVIQEKLENSFKLTYPKLQILVVSDGSTDKTNSILKKYQKRITFCKTETHVGKNRAINKSWQKVRGEIVVFSDANTLYNPDAIQQLIHNFSDPRVGCVSGQLTYADDNAENTYWKYDQFIKQQEGKLGQLTVGTGAIMAIRKKLFRPLQLHIANDFQIPQQIAAQNYLVVYEDKAVGREKAPKEVFKRKVRIINRGLYGFFYFLPTFNMLRLFEMSFHKLLRWFGWLFLVLIFISNALLITQVVYKIIFVLQLLFYIIAFTRMSAMPYYFILINYAACIGFFRFIKGKQHITWKPRMG